MSGPATLHIPSRSQLPNTIFLDRKIRAATPTQIFHRTAAVTFVRGGLPILLSISTCLCLCPSHLLSADQVIRSLNTPMEESYTIQISSNLVNKLARESGQLKKKPKKSKPKKPIVPPKQKLPKPISNSPWPVQSPVFMHVPAQPPSPSPPATIDVAELEAIRSMLQESESIMKKLEQKEATMTEELNRRAKELRDKEFKLPYQNAVPCEAESEACKECYKENSKRLWKCEEVVKKYEDCALKAWKLQQQINSKA